MAGNWYYDQYHKYIYFISRKVTNIPHFLGSVEFLFNILINDFEISELYCELCFAFNLKQQYNL